jgi:glutaredoxin 3
LQLILQEYIQWLYQNFGGIEMTDQKIQPKVVVFSTPTCSFCNLAKSYFREKGVKFTDIDVSRDQAAARDMMRRSGQMGVPVIDIGGKIVVGFNRPQINTLLGIK